MAIAPRQRLSILAKAAACDATQAMLAKITWSYSRRSLLEQCARRYYYEYFGANERLAKNEPAKEALHHLKGIQNRHERAGAILHLIIATYLRYAQRGDVWAPDRLVSWAHNILSKDQQYSRSNPDGGNPPSGKYPPVLLLEYYLCQPDAEQLLAETQSVLDAALGSFATDDCYRDFRSAGATQAALIEHSLKLRNLPCQVSGKLDLAFSCHGEVTVVDWKLGVSDGGGDDSLQLALYGLWAVGHFGCTPEQLRGYKAHLGSRDVVSFGIDDQVLAAARARILQDVERMAAVNEYGRNATVNAFSPCLRPAVCALCPYKRLCSHNQ